jgi:hypothetical protein
MYQINGRFDPMLHLEFLNVSINSIATGRNSKKFPKHINILILSMAGICIHQADILPHLE